MGYIYGYELVHKNGTPVKKRFTSGRVMRTVYEKMTTDDISDAERRAKIRKVYNGYLPYNKEGLKRQGLRAITNVNFLGLRGIVENRATNILRLAQDTAPLVELQPVAKELAGPDAVQIATVIAEEFSSVLRQNGGFLPALAMINKEADLYGLGPVTWGNDTDFIPLALERGQLRFIGTGSVNSSEHDIFMFETTVPASYLFYLLDNEEEAESRGWNVDAVKRLVVATFYENKDTHNQPDNDSGTTPVEEMLSKMRRENLFETAQFETVHLINAYVKETDAVNSISHYVIPGRVVDEKDDDSFLYLKHNAYQHMDQCLLWFPYSVTERYAREVRGLATYLLPIEDVKNRVQSALCDATLRSSSVMLNSKTTGRLSDISITEMGPYTVFSSDLVPVQQQVAPKLQDIQQMSKMLTDLGISVVTGMNELPMVRDDRQYSPSTRQTKAMVQQQEDSHARHEEALFIQRMAMLDKLFAECFRRFINLLKNPAVADFYPEVQKFLDRCELRRLDKKTILEAYDSFQMRTCRDLMLGSEGKSSFLQELLVTMGGTLDEVGRRAAVRDIVSLRLGTQSAERYTSVENRDQTPTDSSSFATQENNAMQNGLPALVASEQLHWSHIPIHAQVLQQITEQVEGQQIEDPEAALRVLEAVSQHIQEHLQYGAMQIGMDSKAKEVNAMLRGLVNTTKALNLLASRQEGVRKAEEEKAQREREDLERRANENELRAAMHKADKEAEIARYKEDRLHEARMAGLQLRGRESAAKAQMDASRTAADLDMRRAESEEKMRLNRENAAKMAGRLDQRASIAGSTPPSPASIAGLALGNATNAGGETNFML